MITRLLGRSAILLACSAALAACSSGGSSTVGGSSGSSGIPRLFNECAWNRSNCMHEGRYEPGEREYAEQEARDLNRASAARLRRGL